MKKGFKRKRSSKVKSISGLRYRDKGLSWPGGSTGGEYTRRSNRETLHKAKSIDKVASSTDKARYPTDTLSIPLPEIFSPNCTQLRQNCQRINER